MIAAILLSFALILVFLAPLGVAYWKPGARLPVALLYGVLLSGLALYHTGLSFAPARMQPAATAAEPPMAESDELTQRCTEALEMAENGSIIRDRSDLERIVVDRTLWSQMPDFVKEGLVRCLELSGPAGRSGADIEIVEE